MRRTEGAALKAAMEFQSTHSLTRMRRMDSSNFGKQRHFNPRTPSQECDKHHQVVSRTGPAFQSTHSLTRMRLILLWLITSNGLHFNPRTPSQECDSNHYQKSLLIPSISYPYCTPPLSKTQPLYFHRTIFSHKSPISQCESSYIFMFT